MIADDLVLPLGPEGLRELRRRRPNPMVVVHGRGPEDETCGTCRHLVAHGYRRTYYKCLLRGDTRSATTDLRLRWPACAKWEGRDDND